MLKHIDLSTKILKILLKNKEICFAGNLRLKIYGALTCKSGKRMKMENRVLFRSESEAVENGYRPCGHCQHQKYKQWIYSTKK
ncbi:metal-binding protein [Pedobacter frigidisoli]|uniref:Metal-binding protein n=1 Tax=Pedobacter frigidisoli TaxID=2530455 RepID=A0A4R0NPG6_9SPHI|nr:Ada metal-binding domain-containing protein [Pedobacter frigidisoli]TCD02129.1 metal-binding protein [Pedobacter frigidisoli]